MAGAKASNVRFAVALTAAAALWAVFLTRFVSLFGEAVRPAPAAQTIEMRLVELAPAEPAQPARTVVPATAVQKTPRSDARVPVQAVRRAERDSPKADRARQDALQPPRSEAATATARAESASTPAPSGGNASEALSTGLTQARLLSQPLPVLPDDLREDALRAEAVARFHVHADGSIDVELIKPTMSPRLNQILLETLHRWRFFPAMDGGHPVDSRQDVRVHLNVS
jgi:protein TonB